MKKKDLTTLKYFGKAKNLTYTLASIGKPMQDDEIVTYLLAGLDGDYDPLVTSITTRSDVMSVSDVYAHLLSFELRLELGADPERK